MSIVSGYWQSRIGPQFRRRYAEADAQNRELLAADQRVFGSEHSSTAKTMENLTSLLINEGHLSEAEKMSRETLAIRSHSLGPDHPTTLTSKINLSIVLLKEGRLGEAEKLQREALATEIRV
jgi:Tetratricopeptide repeat